MRVDLGFRIRVNLHNEVSRYPTGEFNLISVVSNLNLKTFVNSRFLSPPSLLGTLIFGLTLLDVDNNRSSFLSSHSDRGHLFFVALL